MRFDILAYYRDKEWLQGNLDAVYRLISTALHNETDLLWGIDVLLRVFPYALAFGDFKRWAKLLEQAMTQYQVESGDVIDGYETFVVPHSYIVIRQKSVASPQRKSTMKRKPRRRQSANDLLERYLAILAKRFNEDASAITDEHIDSLLIFARMVNTRYLYYKVYQLIAFIHLHKQAYDKAIVLGHFTYRHWQVYSDTISMLEMGFSASALFSAYTAKQLHEDASYWNQISDRLVQFGISFKFV